MKVNSKSETQPRSRKSLKLDLQTRLPEPDEYHTSSVFEAFLFERKFTLFVDEWGKWLEKTPFPIRRYPEEPLETRSRSSSFISSFGSKAKRACGLMNTATVILEAKALSLAWLVKQENHYLLEFAQFKNGESRQLIEQLETMGKEFSLFTKSILKVSRSQPKSLEGNSSVIADYEQVKQILRMQTYFEFNIKEFVEFHNYLEDSLEACCQYYYSHFYFKSKGASNFKIVVASVTYWISSIFFFGGKNLKFGNFLMEITFLAALGSFIYFLKDPFKKWQNQRSGKHENMIEFAKRSLSASEDICIEVPKQAGYIEIIDIQTLLQYWEARVSEHSKTIFKRYKKEYDWRGSRRSKPVRKRFDNHAKVCNDELKASAQNLMKGMERLLSEISRASSVEFSVCMPSKLLKKEVFKNYNKRIEAETSEQRLERLDMHPLRGSEEAFEKLSSDMMLIRDRFLERQFQGVEAIQKCRKIFRDYRLKCETLEQALFALGVSGFIVITFYYLECTSNVPGSRLIWPTMLVVAAVCIWSMTDSIQYIHKVRARDDESLKIYARLLTSLPASFASEKTKDNQI